MKTIKFDKSNMTMMESQYIFMYIRPYGILRASSKPYTKPYSSQFTKTEYVIYLFDHFFRSIWL